MARTRRRPMSQRRNLYATERKPARKQTQRKARTAARRALNAGRCDDQALRHDPRTSGWLTW